MQEAAYIEGYMAAELREREKRQKARERQKERGISLPKTLRCGNAYSYGGFSKAIRGGYNSCVYSGSNGNSANYFQGNADCK